MISELMKNTVSFDKSIGIKHGVLFTSLISCRPFIIITLLINLILIRGFLLSFQHLHECEKGFRLDVRRWLIVFHSRCYSLTTRRGASHISFACLFVCCCWDDSSRIEGVATITMLVSSLFAAGQLPHESKG